METGNRPVDVAVAPCASYEGPAVAKALEEALAPLGGLGWVRPGMRVAVKPNMVMAKQPGQAATTHPALVAALCRMLAGRGAQVVVGDSPGGPYAKLLVEQVYEATGMAAAAGPMLNRDFSQMDVRFPQARVAKEFPFTAYLAGADAVINLCKLKTHGLVGMSCAVKNLFGVIPGTRKPELHYLYPDAMAFAHMLVDLAEYCKPRLTIVDAVVGMEGNGPTAGTPRPIGALLAARSPHLADLAAAKLIGLDARQVLTLRAAQERGLIPQGLEALHIAGDLDAFVQPGFKIPPLHSVDFKQSKPTLAYLMLVAAFRPRPVVQAEACVGCGACARACPAQAIRLTEQWPAIKRKLCIHCFCCQEFCPQGAIQPQRPWAARVLSR